MEIQAVQETNKRQNNYSRSEVTAPYQIQYSNNRHKFMNMEGQEFTDLSDAKAAFESLQPKPKQKLRIVTKSGTVLARKQHADVA